MTSLFISYTRKDTVFARKLTDNFKDQDLDYWIDWEGIPPTVDWWKEVQKGIEQAGVFVFLLSPDSVRSEVCKREIEHAAKNGKRLVPIVIRDIEADEAPADLSSLNWIFLRDNDDFEIGFNKLITSIKIDYGWVQMHRDLQNKALEWNRKNHENGFLLHGKELQDAESQLALNSSKEPYPTDLQREYVLKSRQANDRVRRRLITGLISFSAIVLLLFVFALTQLNTSRALQFAALAQAAFAEQNYNLSALYTYQSNQIHTNGPASHLLGSFPYENFPSGKGLLGHTDYVHSVAWSADGRLASASNDHTVIIWDLATGQPAQILDGHTARVTSVAWSADGRLASGSDDGTVIIWDLATGQPAQTLLGHTNVVGEVAWSADGRLASGSWDNTVILWDLSTSEPAQILEGHTDGVHSLAWSAGGRLASASFDSTIIIWDLATGQPAQTLLGHAFWIVGVAWSPDGRLASGSVNNTIIIWDLATGQPAQTLLGHTHQVASVAWSADGRLASGSWDNTVILWDLSTGEPAQTLQGHKSIVMSVAWSVDGRLASGSTDRSVIIWDLAEGQSAQTLEGHTDAVSSVAWSADDRLASGSWDNTVIIWDLATGQAAKTLQGHRAVVTSVAWSADGRLASGSWDNTIIIWDLATGQPAKTLQGFSGEVVAVAWSADGRLASVSNSGSFNSTVIIWDLATGQPTQIKEKQANDVRSVSWSADGRLASGSGPSTIIWDLATGQAAQFLEVDRVDTVVDIDTVAWSADGRLASGLSNDTVIIWDLVTNKPAQTFQGETRPLELNLDRSDPNNSVAWSSDGRLASISDNNTVIIWELATGQPAWTLQGHKEAVLSLDWSADGRLASGSTDNTVKISRADIIGSNSCNWIILNMTADEWISNQGVIYIYEPACPSLPLPIIDPVYEWRQNGWYSAFQYALITWKGRLALLIAAIVVVSILAVFFRWLYRLGIPLWLRFFKRYRKEPVAR